MITHKTRTIYLHTMPDLQSPKKSKILPHPKFELFLLKCKNQTVITFKLYEVQMTSNECVCVIAGKYQNDQENHQDQDIHAPRCISSYSNVCVLNLSTTGVIAVHVNVWMVLYTSSHSLSVIQNMKWKYDIFVKIYIFIWMMRVRQSFSHLYIKTRWIK